MKFTLCVPAYNEEEVIVATISELSAVLSHLPVGLSWHIVVADNGSDDKTKEKAISAGDDYVSVLSIDERGKGVAIHTSAVVSDSDFFGFIDADLSANPLVMPEMISMLQSGECDIVVGSRFLDGRVVNRGIWRSLSSRVFNFLQRLILGVKVGDTQCGLKVMNEKGIEVLRQCEERSWFLDLEFLAISEKRGLKIKEIPIKWKEFRYLDRTSKLKVFSGGISAILAMFRIKIRLYKL